MIESLLIANRGEIARRIIRTAKRLDIRTIAVHSEPDADLPFVAEADEAVCIGPANPAQSYRNAEAILAAAKSTGAQAIHPGYGFLSENAGFARTVKASDLVWVGPGADAIAAMGDKINARNLMAAAGVPVAPGTAEPVADVDAAVAAAAQIGYPVMVKAAAGGGGMGMGVAADEAALRTEFGKVRAFAERMFGDGAVLLERYFPRVRHVEVQILGLADGRVVALSERECSVQRRNQKLVEEAPSPAVGPQLRARILDAAVRAGEAVNYRNAGTVECLLDPATGEFFFLEMNTRLQVEHPITELIHGTDLVEQQLRIASGLEPSIDLHRPTRGHAIELRVNAEDPKRFLPGPGRVTTWVEPSGDGVRVDAGYAEGTTVTPFYDSLMAKLIVFGADRADALAKARAAVAGFQIAGPKHNLPFFAELLENPEFLGGDYDTAIVARMRKA
ncbi:acetyl-CoA carboxylase biotin carboxylase subunit [Actinoplanes teichomyceticus]|uniref:biotin carboxylase n=1 Tax=Actinoplanes teichomyceticus TaxID=1867 RepID=A0A561WRJ1_ACTTI|nr:biotin carboxylase N-terminal domain-containing protein [Actinoplanes teichomyceticus]TWG26475.1 acetyl-CoA carboxylase biotin carboxylase subunit [Actinoplanes teichomyceticus]GIF11553.1 acetyl-CoA carboxylase biotin carboxylase subunit [Actinoplanes teichomyceticus]